MKSLIVGLLFLSGASLFAQQDSLPQIDENGVYNYTEVPPLFPGCYEKHDNDEDRKNCSDIEMRKYLQQKAGYPTKALEAGIQGKIVMCFVVLPDGSIDGIEVVRNDSEGDILQNVAIKAVESMKHWDKKWIPGKEDEEAVPVRIVMPFVFKIDNSYTPSPPKKKAKRR